MLALAHQGMRQPSARRRSPVGVSERRRLRGMAKQFPLLFNLKVFDALLAKSSAELGKTWQGLADGPLRASAPHSINSFNATNVTCNDVGDQPTTDDD